MHWPFDDPAAAVGSDAEKIEVFRRVRDQIRSRIGATARNHASLCAEPFCPARTGQSRTRPFRRLG
jgi:arsenate reductase